MKKTFALILSFIFTALLLSGCSSTPNETPPQENNETPTEQTVLPTGIKINLSASSAWEVEHHVNISATISPSNATNQEVTWTFSNPDVAHIYENRLFTDDIGKTTITATTCNGLSDTVEFEVKTFCERNFELPALFTKGTSSYQRTYEISNISFDWYIYTSGENANQYSGKIEFTVEGEKTADRQGQNNTTTDYFAVINVYNNEGYQVGSRTINTSSLLIGDKFKEELTFYDIPLNGAPYTARLLEY